ncbi:MAG: OmpA family protein [Bacteroidales bacterium]
MKKIFILSIIMLYGFSAFAQEETVVQIQAKKGPYITNRFFDNWFLSVGGGVQVYFGESDARASFGKRIAPALDISLGKWITPAIGLRLQYSGLQAKGWTYGVNPYSDSPLGNGFYKEKFNTMNIHADVMWNVSNAWGGYREDRFWSFIPYAGFGWARSCECGSGGTHKNEIAATFGLLHNLRISNAFDVNIEMKGMVVNQRYAYTTGSHGVNVLGTITAGITYKFKTRGFQRTSDIVVVDDNSMYINQISDLQNQLATAQANRDALAKKLAAEQAKEAKVVKEMYPILPDMAIFFELNRAKISDKGMINIEYIANVIKQVPNKNFILYASADKETGTPNYNLKLSQRRGEAVYNALINKFGINPNQLKIEAVGSSEQRFNGAQLNRVVIIQDNEKADL